jgi:hypothetical protein
MDLFPDAENHVTMLDDLYDELILKEIDLYESVADSGEEKVERETTDLEKELEVLSSLDSRAISDPVRMYLREIGRIPDADQEIDLAQKTEAGCTGKRKINFFQPASRSFDCQEIYWPWDVVP